ncbi:hypothetical protein BpHYR1_027366 [Brachionus plicatilis]|uniref:Uncharacterized protein n=1 Tax=Brachionus plicatilis TaxID=10195 RepID=A0A3M7PR45_BRAPC|nr:hypothetical protein BpHYR1_027366 [Brachionus plicatilis]
MPFERVVTLVSGMLLIICPSFGLLKYKLIFFNIKFLYVHKLQINLIFTLSTLVIRHMIYHFWRIILPYSYVFKIAIKLRELISNTCVKYQIFKRPKRSKPKIIYINERKFFYRKGRRDPFKLIYALKSEKKTHKISLQKLCKFSFSFLIEDNFQKKL